MLSRSKAAAILIAAAIAIIVAAFFLHPIPQSLTYHNFADHRGWLNIHNFGDVASNLGFAIAGIWGLIVLLAQPIKTTFDDPRERPLYIVMFAGMLLTAFGSGYYHLAPDNLRLVWDRLPMTVVFMSLIAAVIAERISISAALWLFAPLLAIGAASVWQWRQSELAGHGDLRFYAAVQLYAIVALLLMLLVPSKYTRSPDFGVVVAFYIAAKLLETYDRQVFAATGQAVSGHTLKHLAAAAAGYWILRMLEKRKLKTDI